MLVSNASRLRVRDGGRIRLIPLGGIDWIEITDSRVHIHTQDGRFVGRGRLSDYAQDLAAQGFLRIHRSTIVNFQAIRELRSAAGGDHVAILRSGQALRVSRTYASELYRQVDRLALTVGHFR